MLNCFLHLSHISQSPRCIDFTPKSVSYSCIFLLTTVIDPVWSPLVSCLAFKISPGWFLYFCLSTNVISRIGELFILEACCHSLVCGSFLPFLHTWTNSNALKVMCASASSTSALSLPIFQWVPFFP